MLADSHVHLDFPDFGQDLAQVLHRARAGGVDYFNVIGTRLKQVAELNQLKQEIAGSITSLGIHPHHAAEEPTSESYIQQAVEACQAHAVGETGLDFHYDFSPRPIQEEVFRYHLRVAQRLNLPVVIHTREAEERTRMIVEEEGLPAAGGVLHCFTGSESMAQWAMEQGLHISFSGVLTFRTGEDLRRIAANLPLERILLETDAPYLAPIPHRGKRNEPSFLVHTAKTLAQVRQISLDQVATATTDNFLRLFRVAGNSMTGDKGTLAYAIGDALYLNISRGQSRKSWLGWPHW
ncbi:MAG: TatD family hydrolase [Magnetococcales bacterium]|nr:TatD family hydrolase [Magnetococcales bacterium]